MNDTDTALYLAEFKEKYLEPIKRAHIKYQSFKELPEDKAKEADSIRDKYFFFSSFCLSVEATIEQNILLKNKL